MRLACGLAIALGLSFPAAGQTPAPPAPAEQVPAETAPEAGDKAQESVVPEKTAATQSAKTKSTTVGPARVTAKRRKRTPRAPDGAPRRVVVREGGTSEPAAQIVPSLTPAEATRQRQNAERLLGSTGDQLKLLASRSLDAERQETFDQIRNYMDGSRSALKEGDVQRANTLAEKAHLLAEDLAKH